METTTDIGVVDRAQRLLLAIYYLELMDVHLAQFLADDLGEWVHLRLVDVGDLKGGGIHFVGCSHATDDRHFLVVASLDEVEFCLDGVNAIHYIVELRNVDGIGCLWEVKHLVFMNDTAAINVMYTLLAYIYFMLSYGTEGSDNLAVDIGKAYTVVIDDVQLADTTTCQRLDHITSHATYAEYGDTASHERINGSFTHQ